MANGPNGNRMWITVGITVLLGCITGAFIIGGHVGNGEIHQSQSKKQEIAQEIVDRSIDREIKPMFREIQRRLASLEQAENRRSASNEK